jgi:hypothetical protein
VDEVPNGKPTKITERQWVQVRTPLFKDNYFGDWETPAIAGELADGKAIASITGGESKKDPAKDLRTQAAEYFKSVGGEVYRDGVGKVLLDEAGVKSSIAHGMSRKKAAAFKTVPDIIKHGVTIDRQTNWKGRGYDTEVIDAVISIGGKNHIAEVIINKYPNGRNTYYLNKYGRKNKAPRRFSPGTSNLIIGQKLDNVKGKVSAGTRRPGSRLLCTTERHTAGLKRLRKNITADTFLATTWKPRGLTLWTTQDTGKEGNPQDLPGVS